MLTELATPSSIDALVQSTPASDGPDDELNIRIRGEFEEMPGLILTLRQAARLFSVETMRCADVLAALVREGHLATDGESFFVYRA
jgi:hypothetical protein